jgi:hypothetical protein
MAHEGVAIALSSALTGEREATELYVGPAQDVPPIPG